MDAEKDGGFTGNLRDLIGGLLVGLLPLVTLVPMFVNKIDKITHLSLDISFKIFIFLYFLVPVLFIYIWVFLYLKREYSFPYKAPQFRLSFYEILANHDTRLDAEATGWLFLAAFGTYLIITLLAFIFFYSLLGILYYVFTILITLIGGVLLLACVIRYKDTRYVLESHRSSDQERLRERLRSAVFQYEAFLIALFIVAILGLLPGKLASNNDRVVDMGSTFKQIERTDTLRKMILKTDSFQKQLEGDYLRSDVQTGDPTGDMEKLQQDVTRIDLVIGGLNELYRDSNSRFPPQYVDTAFKHIRGDVERLRIYGRDSATKYIALTITRLRHLASVGANTLSVSQGKVKENWAVILKTLRYKGLLLFFLTLFLLFSGWFLSTIEDIRRENDFEVKNTRIIGGKPSRHEYQVVEKKEYVPFPIILVLKRCIIIIVLLIVPFYKPVDPETVDLDKPFMNLSLEKVYRTEADYPPPQPISIDSSRWESNPTFAPVTINKYGPTIQNIDSIRNIIIKGQKMDSDLLKKIYTLTLHNSRRQ